MTGPVPGALRNSSDILIEFKYVPLGRNKLTGKQVRAMSMAELAELKPVEACGR